MIMLKQEKVSSVSIPFMSRIDHSNESSEIHKIYKCHHKKPQKLQNLKNFKIIIYLTIII